MGFGHHDVPSWRKRDGDRVVIHRVIIIFFKKLAFVTIQLDRTTNDDRDFFIRFIVAFTIDNEQSLRLE